MNKNSKKIISHKNGDKSHILNNKFQFKETINENLKREELATMNKKQRRKRMDDSHQSSFTFVSHSKSINMLKNCGLKENIPRTTFISKNSTPVGTPLQFQKTIEWVERKMNKNDYKYIHQIGSGGFGSVWKVRNKQNGEILAMKQISKAKVIMKKSVASVINEKMLLDHLSNPFIINTHQAFQDRDYLYLLMEYLRGGDLRYHLCYKQFFSEEETKFIIACIVLSLEYIHSQEIIHRDLKPQNLVFQQNGYVRLTDFGVARKRKMNNSQQTSGTPGYMAPEVICRMNHSYQADYFALGVIAYEMVTGTRPYIGDSRKQIRDKIVAQQAKINENDLPSQWSKQCADFINKLLKRSKQSRLGYNGSQQVKNHPWLKSINWKKLAKKQYLPPYQPGVLSESSEYQREMQNSQQTELDEQTVMLLRTPQMQLLFKKYQTYQKHQKMTTSRKYGLKG